MITEIRRITTLPGKVIQITSKERHDSPVTVTRTYDGEVARLIIDVVEYVLRDEQNEVKS